MRKKCLLALTLLLLLALWGCTAGQEEPEGAYQLYFTRSWSDGYGSALGTQSWEGEGPPDPQSLMQALLAGPTAEGLSSPFPKGAVVQSMEMDAEEGVLRLTMSEQYGDLTDISQTLADACIVLTGCQLPGVDAVEISTSGFWASRLPSRLLTPESFELEALIP